MQLPEYVSFAVQLLQLYAAVGLAFAFAFVVRGANRIDPSARIGTRGFRVLIFPGAAALWPLLLVRWLRSSDIPESENTGEVS